MKGLFELDSFKGHDEIPENLMLVDCLNLSFRYKHKKQFEFAADYLRTISSLATSYKAMHVVLLADKRSSAYRRAIYPEYKGNRVALYENQSEQEAQEAELFFEGYERALELASSVYPHLRIEYVEADDLAAYIVGAVHLNYKNVWLISSDRDWDLLLKHNVHRFSFVTRKEYTLENFFDEHGCDNPDQYASIKAIQGDSGDNIPGVSGIGIKRAYSLVKEHGSVLDIADKLPLSGKQQFIANINGVGADFLYRNFELVDLVSQCATAIAYPNPNNLDQVNEFIRDNLEYYEDDE